MQVVTDSGMDLTTEQRAGLDFHIIPLVLTLDGISYRSGVDIEPDAFYKILEASTGLPTTSQPSPGDFAEIYRQVLPADPDILSVHISSGLSGTLNSAIQAVKLVPEANIICYDTKTLSGAEGWHVEAAARAARAGWSIEQTVALLRQVSAATDTLFTLPTLKYLIHGGRISHLRGLVASVLQIKPQIGVDKETGKYYDLGRSRTWSRAVARIPELIVEKVPRGTRMRAQILHAANPGDAEILKEHMGNMFDCQFEPTGAIAPVLGAHTGPGLVGLAYAPLDAYPDLP
jgi:DegV family protein with EDD domain